ncbi:MAG: hypothetical protein AAF705_08030, partial [Bacteroidota bacterium]
DLSLIQQYSPAVTEKDLHLFQPRKAYRTNVSNYGVSLNFFLKETPKSGAEVALMIQDKNGKTIRTYKSDASNRLNRIRASKGLNSFSWDQRYDGPELVKDLVTMVLRNPSPGPRAVPGSYTAVLKIGDLKAETSIEIANDPRWTDVTNADYQAQLDMGLEMSEMLDQAHRRVKNLRAVKVQINSATKLAAQLEDQATLKSKSKATINALDAVEALILQNKAEASQDAINYPRVFSNHLGRLYGVVTGAHHRPTDGAKERLEDLKLEYQTIVEAYEKVMRTEVAEFESFLSTTGVERIIRPEKIGTK